MAWRQHGRRRRDRSPLALSKARQIERIDRRKRRVRALAKACGAEPLAREQVLKRHFDAVVHSTPLGMFPHLEGCFFDGEIPADVVFDLVYNPLETTLIRRAREQNKIV